MIKKKWQKLFCQLINVKVRLSYIICDGRFLF